MKMKLGILPFVSVALCALAFGCETTNKSVVSLDAAQLAESKEQLLLAAEQPSSPIQPAKETTTPSEKPNSVTELNNEPSQNTPEKEPSGGTTPNPEPHKTSPSPSPTTNSVFSEVNSITDSTGADFDKQLVPTPALSSQAQEAASKSAPESSTPTPNAKPVTELKGETSQLKPEKESDKEGTPIETQTSKPPVPPLTSPVSTPETPKVEIQPTPSPNKTNETTSTPTTSPSKPLFVGRVVLVNSKKHFVIIDFNARKVPPLRSELGVYRNNQFVGSIRITPPIKPPLTSADILMGTLRRGDEVR